MTNNNSKDLISFMAYCANNKDLRFWQALRNWSGADYVYIQRGGGPVSTAIDIDGEHVQLQDTFYMDATPRKNK